ncbi:MAG: hypothetical protein JAY74_05755 [Candidatus Thiodiazotropha taylori]|nr:hypothetical protein [Candidatus Thiodiazotropha taylori]
MLYQTIVSKSIELERELTQGKLDKETTRTFIKLLSKSIPKLFSPASYSKGISLLLKWETIGYDHFKIQTEEIHSPSYSGTSVTESLISDQAQMHAQIKRLRGSDSEDAHIQWIGCINPIYITKIDRDPDTPIEKKIRKADAFYKESELIKSWLLCNEVINNTEKEDARVFSNAFYSSWAMHLKANILAKMEHYSAAYAYYDEAFIIKRNLRHSYLQKNREIQEEDKPIWGLLLYSFYKTQFKRSSLNFGLGRKDTPNQVLEVMRKARRQVEIERDLFDELNPDFYHSLITTWEYSMGKIHLYEPMLDDATGIDFLSRSEKLSKNEKDYPAQIRATIFGGVFNPKQPDIEIERKVGRLLDDLPPILKKSPVLKSLIGEQHLLEYDIAKEKEGLGARLYAVFNEHKVTRHNVSIDMLLKAQQQIVITQ